MNWLAKFAEQQKSEAEVLQDTFETLPKSMLEEYQNSFDPESRPTEMDAMVDKIADAERMGRELATDKALEKTALLGALMGAAKGFATGGIGGAALGAAKAGVQDAVVGGASKAVSGALKASSGGAGSGFSYGGKFAGVMGNLGGVANKAVGFLHQNPGAAVTLAGAAGGAMLAPRDQQTGQKQYLRGALMGGGLAAGANALSQGRIADKAKSMVTRQNNPVLGQGVRRSVITSAYKGTRPGAGAAASAVPNSNPVAGAAGPVAEAAPFAAAPGAAPAAAGSVSPNFLQRLRNRFSGTGSGAGAAGEAIHAGGPYMGQVKIASIGQYIEKLAMQKRAFAGLDDIPGLAVGLHFGNKQRERGEEHDFGAPQLGSLLLPGGLGYQVGRAIGHSNKPKEDKEKKANQATLTYDPSTKTFVRQHLTPDTSMGNSGTDVIPAGTAEPVGRGVAGRGSNAGQVAPPGTPPSGGMSQVHTMNGGNTMSSSPGRGMMATPARRMPPPIPAAARMGGPAGLAGAAAKTHGLPSLAGAVSLRR